MRNIAAVYRIVNVINGKGYVGATGVLVERWQQHRQNLRTNIHHSQHLQHAYNKYGKDNFVYEILEEVPDISKLDEREQYWIDLLDTTNPEKGYNICPKAGSTRGRKQSEETKKKISIANLGHPVSEENREKARQRTKGNKYNLGKKRTPEQIENIRRGHLGKTVPEYVRQMAVESRRKNGNWNRGLTKESDARIAKMSASLQGREAWNKGIWKATIPMEELKQFYLDEHTIKECMAKFNAKESSIRKALLELGIMRTKTEALNLAHKRKKQWKSRNPKHYKSRNK